MEKYSVMIQWSDEDESFVATVPELPDLSAFGETPEEAAKELREAKKLYLEVLAEDGEEIPEPDILKPFSGQLRIRIPRSLHASLTTEAKKEGISLNAHIVSLLSERNAFNKVKNEIKIQNRQVAHRQIYILPQLPMTSATINIQKNIRLEPDIQDQNIIKIVSQLAN